MRVRLFCIASIACLAIISAVYPAWSESYRSVQERRPDLFHPETGYRIARHRAPTPEDIPAPVTVIRVEEAAGLLSRDALAIDVSGALQSRFDELEGTWLVRGARQSLPGAIWLPEVGRGALEPEMEGYLKSNLLRLTEGNQARDIIVFCMADCWMSWNAAQRIAGFGYLSVYWFPEGTDGWIESGRNLRPALPVPVKVD